MPNNDDDHYKKHHDHHEPHDHVRVFVRDCAVQLYVGVYDHEKPKPQTVIINVETGAHLTQRFDDIRSDDIGTVIDYEQIFDFITVVLPGLGHITLLESIGEQIINFCFKDARIRSVHVRLEKPEAFKGEARVGIEMRRRREA